MRRAGQDRGGRLALVCLFWLFWFCFFREKSWTRERLAFFCFGFIFLEEELDKREVEDLRWCFSFGFFGFFGFVFFGRAAGQERVREDLCAHVSLLVFLVLFFSEERRAGVCLFGFR